FSITIANLAPPDLYHLLMFLKTVEKKNASPIFLEATRTLRKAGALDLNDIRGGSMEIRSGDFTDNDMKTLFASQESQYQGKYPEDEMLDLRAGLKKALNDRSSRFYIYRKDGEIATSVRFGDRDRSE